jgi:hypothetical protein
LQSNKVRTTPTVPGRFHTWLRISTIATQIDRPGVMGGGFPRKVSRETSDDSLSDARTSVQLLSILETDEPNWCLQRFREPRTALRPGGPLKGLLRIAYRRRSVGVLARSTTSKGNRQNSRSGTLPQVRQPPFRHVSVKVLSDLSRMATFSSTTTLKGDAKTRRIGQPMFHVEPVLTGRCSLRRQEGWGS